jgi:hypothetical protein
LLLPTLDSVSLCYESASLGAEQRRLIHMAVFGSVG